jgi:hypothetical protein
MPFLIAAWFRENRTDAAGWSGYIRPTMSEGPSWVSMNRES